MNPSEIMECSQATPLGRSRIRFHPAVFWLRWESLYRLMSELQEVFLQTERNPDEDSEWEQPEQRKQVIEVWMAQRTGLLGESLKQVSQVLEWELFGWSLLERYVSDPEVTDIMANAREIWVQRHGVKTRMDRRFRDEQQITGLARKIAHTAGQSLTTGQPFVTCFVRGMRVNVMIPPTAPEGTTIIIRKFREQRWTEQEYIRTGTLSHEVWSLLAEAMEAGLTGIISGPMGSGKTTLLQSLVSYIPDGEGTLVAETITELFLKTIYPTKCIISVVPRLHGHEASRVNLVELFENALHQNMRRFLFGEIRSGVEAVLVMEAFQTGHSGWTTMHADDPQDAAQRLVTMCLRGHGQMDPEYTGKMVAHAVDIIVQMHHYRVTEVAEVVGYRNGEAEVVPLFQYEDGRWEKRNSPSPSLLSKLKRRSTQ